MSDQTKASGVSDVGNVLPSRNGFFHRKVRKTSRAAVQQRETLREAW